MPRNISQPKPPVKTFEQISAEQRQADIKFKARVREFNKAEREKPLSQNLGKLLRAASL